MSAPTMTSPTTANEPLEALFQMLADLPHATGIESAVSLHDVPKPHQILTVQKEPDNTSVRVVIRYGTTNQVIYARVFDSAAHALEALRDLDTLVPTKLAGGTKPVRIVTPEEVSAWANKYAHYREALIEMNNLAEDGAQNIPGTVRAEFARLVQELELTVLAARIRAAHPEARRIVISHHWISEVESTLLIEEVQDLTGRALPACDVDDLTIEHWTFEQLRRTFAYCATPSPRVAVPLIIQDITSTQA